MYIWLSNSSMCIFPYCMRTNGITYIVCQVGSVLHRDIKSLTIHSYFMMIAVQLRDTSDLELHHVAKSCHLQLCSNRVVTHDYGILVLLMNLFFQIKKRAKMVHIFCSFITWPIC